MTAFIPVYGGTFTCPHCGRRWVGTWHGPKKDMHCIVCKKPLYEEDEE